MKTKIDCLSMGFASYGHPTIISYGQNARMVVGKFCSIADNVTVLLEAEHRPNWVTTYPFNTSYYFNSRWPEVCSITGHPHTKGNIIVENDVWIGYGALLMSGITIHSGAVIAAYAVVTKDVPPYTIVAGNPARVVKKRFPDEIIDKLLQIAWWDWPMEKIRDNVKLLCSERIEDFVERNLP